MDTPSNFKVVWSRLRDAYGGADEVGEILSQLGRGEDAWGELYNRVLHQGTIYEATAPVAAWLIDALTTGKLGARMIPVGKPFGSDQTLSERTLAMGLLSGLASSAVKATVATEQSHVSSGQTRERYAAIGTQVLEALRSGIPLFEGALADDQREIRLTSAAILKAVALDRQAKFVAVRKHYDKEPDCEVRVALLSALNRLSEADRTWFDYLVSILDRPCSGHEKFYALAYLIQRFGAGVPERFSDQFGELFATLPEPGTLDTGMLSDLEDPATLFWRATRALKPATTIAVLCRALDMCGEPKGYSGRLKVLRIAEWLLRVVSEDDRTGWDQRRYRPGATPEHSYTGIEEVTKPGTWVRSQRGRAALKAIAESKAFWLVNTNLLSLFGLPREREPLRKLIRPRPASKTL